MEIWKKINDFNDYEISITGLIRRNGVILKPYHNKKNDSHLKIKLSKNGKRKAFYIHQLVAKTYIPNPLNLTEVNHIDHNPENNSVTNLEWISHKNNCEDAAKFRRIRDTINQPCLIEDNNDLFTKKNKNWVENE